MARLSLLAVLSAVVASATAAAVSPRQDAAISGAAVQARRRSGGGGCSAAPTVHLKNGTYYGVYNPTYHQDMFLGMPYAEPPVGDLRFRPPQPLSTRSWKGRRNATEYSPICFGYGSDTWVLGNYVSEDCLTINVVRPHGVKPDAKLPVAVWIHGGSLANGGSSDPRYNMSFIVEQSVRMGTPFIAASINYRLHAWGFLWSDEMKKAGAGNLGFRDQRLALQWVRENIGAFRGDPDKVTLWGESAGGRSVATQMLAYGGRDDKLYRGAILQSGTGFDIDLGEVPRAGDVWQDYYDALAAKVGCGGAGDSLACLRAVPAWTLSDAINATAGPVFRGVVDGDFLRAPRHKLIGAGNFTRVPVVIGANFDEGTGFGEYGIDTEAQWRAYLRDAGGAGNVTAEVLSALYPDIPRVGIPATLHGRPPPVAGHAKKYGAMWKRASAFGGDRSQHGPRRLWARTWARAGLPIWSYHFNVLVNGISPYSGATHFQEVAFVFNNTDGLGYETAVAVNPFAGKPATFGKLADVMSRMWVGFIASGDPNAHGGVTDVRWPRYDNSDEPRNMVFDVNVTALAYAEPDTYRTEQIEYLIQKLWS